MTDQPTTDNGQPATEAEALARQVAEAYESQLRYLRKWERGLSGNEAPRILHHHREHPITAAFITVLREWREEAMEDLVEPGQPDAQLRERLGYVRALRDVEDGVLNIQIAEEEGNRE